MAKLLAGSELAAFIKERQAKQVRNLRQEYKIAPKLAIVVNQPTPVIESYMRAKKAYGEDILIETEVFAVSMDDISATIERLNADDTIHAIIVQLPLSDMNRVDEITALVAPEKDVDGLGSDKFFTPATAQAIQWLLAGHNIELTDKELLIIGHGRLVGAPLAKLWHDSGLTPKVVDRSVENLSAEVSRADVIVTATGAPAIIEATMVKSHAVIIDAGTTSEDGQIVGDVAPEVYDRDDIRITPTRGGVGPLTVASLFDNVIQAARQRIEQ